MRKSSRRRTPNDFVNLSALSSIHRNRGKILGKQGKPTEALQELRDAVDIDKRIAPAAAMHRYDLACSFAQCCAIAVRLGANADAEHYAEQALIELRSAWGEGWKDLKGIESDPDLDAAPDPSGIQGVPPVSRWERGQTKTLSNPGGFMPACQTKATTQTS